MGPGKGPEHPSGGGWWGPDIPSVRDAAGTGSRLGVPAAPGHRMQHCALDRLRLRRPAMPTLPPSTCLSGRGEMWRRQGAREEVVAVQAGVCLTIPLGTHFQFRSLGDQPLAAVGVTMRSMCRVRRRSRRLKSSPPIPTLLFFWGSNPASGLPAGWSMNSRSVPPRPRFAAWAAPSPESSR